MVSSKEKLLTKALQNNENIGLHGALWLTLFKDIKYNHLDLETKT